MTFWLIAGIIAIAGSIGGVFNAYFSDSGFFSPGMYEVEGRKIWKPGALGNVVTGAFAAFVSWGLYGPFSQTVLIPLTASTDGPFLSLEALVGALLAGVGGSRVVTSEVEKRVLSKAAATAADKAKNSDAAANIATASSPSEALRVAEKMDD